MSKNNKIYPLKHSEKKWGGKRGCHLWTQICYGLIPFKINDFDNSSLLNAKTLFPKSFKLAPI